MANYKQYISLFSLVLILIGCSSSDLYIGKEPGSLYKTSELRRSPSDDKKVSIQGTVYKVLKNDFFLVQDSYGLILIRMKPNLLGEDTSYNKETTFLFSGETETESSHFHIKVDKLERVQ